MLFIALGTVCQRMLFSLCYRKLIRECAHIAFSAASKEPGVESVKTLVAVTIEGGCLVLPSTYAKVALWKAVSGKLSLEIRCSLDNVNSLASMWPSAMWVRIVVDAHTQFNVCTCMYNCDSSEYSRLSLLWSPCTYP